MKKMINNIHIYSLAEKIEAKSATNKEVENEVCAALFEAINDTTAETEQNKQPGVKLDWKIEIKERSTITVDSIEEFEDYVNSIKSTLLNNEKIISIARVVGVVLIVKTT